jgi:hypothetical protein
MHCGQSLKVGQAEGRQRKAWGQETLGVQSTGFASPVGETPRNAWFLRAAEKRDIQTIWIGP